MKRKLGKSLCSMLLALTMVMGLMPGMSLTAKAAPAETLLTTITPTNKTSYSETKAGVVTVSHHNDDYSGGNNGGWTWYSVADTLRVSGCEGYTITKVIFKQGPWNFTDSSAPFELHFEGSSMVMCRENFQMDGVTSIQVYGYANTVDTPSAAISPENSGTVSVTFDSASNNWIFTASPAEGYVFVEWNFLSDGDSDNDESNPLSVNRNTFRNWSNLTAVFEEAPAQTYTVTYSVVNGTWSDYTTTDKTETVQSGSAPASVPSGMIAGSGFTGGSWNADPSSATITGNITFTYTFEAESVDPDTPTPEPVTPAPESEVPADTTPSGSSSPAPVITPEQAREMTIRHFVERLYVEALGRQFDKNGRDAWADILMAGGSASAVARGFFNSQEFIARELDNEEFVNILYRVFFDREPDTQGFANWINALENGATRSEVINEFTGSTEWTSMCARYGVNA